MLRNYDYLYNFDGKQKFQVFIPEFYLTKAVQYVDPSNGQELLEKTKDAVDKSSSSENKEFYQKEEKIAIEMRRTYLGTVDNFLAKCLLLLQLLLHSKIF